MQTANSLLCQRGANYIRQRFGQPSAPALPDSVRYEFVAVKIANIFEAEPHQMSAPATNGERRPKMLGQDHIGEAAAVYA
jgi:hypothetical protein